MRSYYERSRPKKESDLLSSFSELSIYHIMNLLSSTQTGYLAQGLLQLRRGTENEL